MSLTSSKLIRRTHLYLALFVTPWMIVYALSGLALNHGNWLRGIYGPRFAQFEKTEERPFTAAFSADTGAREMGGQILEQLGLTGSFNVQGNSTSPRVVVTRNGAFSAHRVTWIRSENLLLIEKQTYSLPVFFNRLHFRHGYEQPFLASRVWALTVDLAIVAMIFWALSGVWMWWEIRPARVWGAACGLLGLGLFGLMLAVI